MKAAYDDQPPSAAEQAALWYIQLAEGELSAEEQRAFDQWLEDPDNADAFDKTITTWNGLDVIADTAEVVQMRSEALDSYRRSNLKRWQRPRSWLPTLWTAGAAAGLAAVLLVGWSMISWLNLSTSDFGSDRQAATERSAFITPIGERRLAVLNDGSRISLDADSEVQTSFDQKRRSLLLTKGRAKFDVAHNPLRPFTVTVGNKIVVATGTSFSVERLGGAAHIILFQGHVDVLDARGQNVATNEPNGTIIRMEPGQELTLPVMTAGAATVAPTDRKRALSWQQGQVSFDNEPLALAVERMNRYLREPLIVADVQAADVRVTGVFEATNAAGFIDALRLLSGVRAEREGGKVLLTKE